MEKHGTELRSDRFVVVHVAGTGKGCGKTSFICRMLTFFPGAIVIKSGIDPERKGAASSDADTARYLHAGAGAARLFEHSREIDMETYLYSLPDTVNLVIIERHRRLSHFTPDFYIFIDRPVSRRRDDADQLKRSADYVVLKPTPTPEIIRAIREEIAHKVSQRVR